MMMTHCQDRILTENVWSKTSYSGDKVEMSPIRDDERLIDQGSIGLFSQWMLDDRVLQFHA